ncbi:hypothetical protein MKX03_033508, partial [Papaver bracteatum]
MLKWTQILILPFITATADGPKHIETTKFEEFCSDLLDRLEVPVQNSLKDAKLSFKDLDEVILVGGSTRIPTVQELVKDITITGDEAFKLIMADPDTILDYLT